MRIRTLAIIGLALALAACSPAAEAPGADGANAGGGAVANSIQPGQYRTTVTVLEMNIPGIKQSTINMEPMTSEDCVTSADVADFTSGNIADEGSGETCTQSNMSTSGGRIQGQATCTGPQGTRTMQLDGAYTSNHVEMEIASTSDMPGSAGQMTQRLRIVTDRIGACPGGEAAD